MPGNESLMLEDMGCPSRQIRGYFLFTRDAATIPVRQKTEQTPTTAISNQEMTEDGGDELL
ncbi:hypothetical protein HY36_14910 [Hyphomonas atlantica]|uniref:Uncharacterized protein n=2 Tax=Hyphomonas atlantica TaxID=1280948 RepID=A0A059E601_9PROT|nr:hypothetical protein HY36_14910 [Hyphomonas atlantica]